MEGEKFQKRTESIVRSLAEVQQQKLDVMKKLNTSSIALKCFRKKHQIFIQNNADLENRLQDVQEKLRTAIVRYFLPYHKY